MSWDKVNNPPVGTRGGPADTPNPVGPQGNPNRPDGTQEGPPGLRDKPAPSTRGRGNGHEQQHPRVQDVLNEGKQKVQQLLERVGDATGNRPRAGRGEEHVPPGQAKKLGDDGGPDVRDTGPRGARESGGDDQGRSDKSQRVGNDDRGRSHESNRHGQSEHGRSHESHGRGHNGRDGRVQSSGRGDDNDGRSNFRTTSNGPNGNAHGLDHSRGRGHLESHGRGPANFLNEAHGNLNLPSVVAYLRGEAGGSHLPRELRQVLDSTSRVLGTDLLAALERRGASGEGKHAVRILGHALARVARSLDRVAEAGGPAASNVTPRVFKEAVGELLAATMLDKYFRRAESTGGRVVAQAEAALARLLYGDGRGEGNRRPAGYESSPRGYELRPAGYETARRPEMTAPHPLEVLRDLQAGAFRPVEVSRSPFPLSGRALVATEMMELMRTLDAVEAMTRELSAATRGGASTLPAPGLVDGEEAPLLALLRVLAGRAGGVDVLDELLSMLTPTLPGRAAQLEIPRLVAALGGVLVDAEGHAFVAKDGVPLKLDQLLWLGSLGGVLKGAESSPVSLSPLLVYGFDAVYSLIGFDGRTLNPPHFAAVQAQVNGSELEWVYGQPPLSEGWMRALIERLKDSAQAEHNLLGEMLEEALAGGRFHAALVGGTVSEGEARPDTFAVTRLLPAMA